VITGILRNHALYFGHTAVERGLTKRRLASLLRKLDNCFGPERTIFSGTKQ
jgi:hypothetical protein